MTQTLKPVLTAVLAKRIAEACEARARQEGWNMIIAVVDTGGNLKHYTRMDDAVWQATSDVVMLANAIKGRLFAKSEAIRLANNAPD